MAEGIETGFVPETDPFGSYDWGNIGGDMGQPMFFDTYTGQTVTGAQAAQLDPTFAQQFAQAASTAIPGLNTGGYAPPGNAPDGGGGLLNWIGANPLQAGALGMTGLATGVGLIGVIQRAMQGDQTARVELTRQIAQASPQEQQAIQQAITGLTGVQNFALGGPTSLQAQLGARVGPEEGAFQSGVQGLGTQAQNLGQLGTALSPSYLQGLPGLLQGQESILNAYTPTGTALAGGDLPITPGMERTVEQAFSPMFGDVASRLIEESRQRGFAGGAELLLQAPASSIGQTALRDLQGQMAAAKLNLAQAHPGLVAQAAGAYSTPAALRIQGASQLQNLNQNLVQALGNVGQQGMGNRLDFLRATSAPLSALGNIGSNLQTGRVGAGGQTQTSTTPTSLLDSFAPLASLLGGVGGSLSGLALANSLSGLGKR